MSDETAADGDQGSRMMHSVLRGIMIGTPVGLLIMIAMVFIGGDATLHEALVAGVWPGLLAGSFFGGFAGLAAAMD